MNRITVFYALVEFVSIELSTKYQHGYQHEKVYLKENAVE